MGEIVRPAAGEVALWGTLQVGREARPVSFADRPFWDKVSAVGLGALAVYQAFQFEPDDYWPLVTGLASLVMAGLIFKGAVSVSKRPAAPHTAWFLSRDRLVVSGRDGAGLAVPVASIAALAPTYAEGSAALEVRAGRQAYTVLTADREGLVASLRKLRPDL